MNISIIPQFSIKRDSSVTGKLNNNFIYPKYNNQLDRDTVTFAAAKNKTEAAKSKSAIENAIEQSYITGEQNFITAAKNFHNTLKNVCEELKDEGFVYDEEYNIKHPVKSFDSYMDKYSRQGYVQDTVRGTVYWKDQTNVASFKKFLDAMKNAGYEIAVIKKKESPESQKLLRYPDIEIRQNGITQEDINILGSFYSKAEISKPRSSTYSDYQMRFVPIRKSGKNENKLPMELIMLYGPHYAKAKELESKYVYNIARSFDNLHIDLNERFPEKSPGRRIANNIDVIKTRLRQDISFPLFKNAYNLDNKIRDEEKLPVVVSKAHCAMLMGYMEGIRQKIPMYYDAKIKELKSDENVIKIIKESTGYKIREDKRITPEEIVETREMLKAMMPKYKAEDLGVVLTAQEMLVETLKKFGEK